MIPRLFILSTLFFFLITNLKGQATVKNTLKYDESTASPNANLEAISWITGHWKGQLSEEETMEEIWSPPMSGSMMGVFKWISNGEVRFYEILTLTEVHQTVILQLKHFGADLKGWEEKDKTIDFKLVKVTPNKVYFDELTFEKVSPNEINVYVVISENGQSSEIKFNYHRVSNNQGNSNQSKEWQIALKTNKAGKVIKGSKRDLINAIRQGQSVKIAWGAKGKNHSIEHVAEPIWLAILDETEVIAHLSPQVLSTTDWKTLTVNYANPSKLKEEWRVAITTKGGFDAIWYDRQLNERIKRVLQNHPITWLVKGGINKNVEVQALFKE